MITFKQGNLLDADAEALVNTVNTVGVMGKGIALMFKDRYPDLFKQYAAACANKEVVTGKVLPLATGELSGPRWVVQFPTKAHWRNPSRLEWVKDGLADLRRFVVREGIRSIALPPLGCGNGGLDWATVRGVMQEALGDLEGVEVHIFEPTPLYQNVEKRTGVQKLTPARALISGLVRRYEILGADCTLLEVQKLAWFLERSLENLGPDNPLNLRFQADRYGPYADPLRHLLEALDGSYLHCARRIADAGPMDVIRFEYTQADKVDLFLRTVTQDYLPAFDLTDRVIDGFQSPFGLELLATVDWLLHREGCEPSPASVRDHLAHWPGGEAAASRKVRIFDERSIGIALERLQTVFYPALEAGISSGV